MVASAPFPVSGVAHAVDDERTPQSLNAVTLLGIGAYLVACLLVGLGLGWLADEWLGSTPALTLAGLFLGIAAGVFGTWQRIKPLRRG